MRVGPGNVESFSIKSSKLTYFGAHKALTESKLSSAPKKCCSPSQCYELGVLSFGVTTLCPSWYARKVALVSLASILATAY